MFKNKLKKYLPHFFICFRYICLIIIFYILNISQFPSSAFAQKIGVQTNVTADISQLTSLIIFGYTSPNSLVQVIGIRVFAQTAADRTGYFYFNDVPISSEAQEICLTTIDSERRVGFPLCITIPDTAISREIGPLLLAPTLTISSSSIWQNQSVFAIGRTIPDQIVQVSFFEIPASSLSKRLASTFANIFHPSVWAREFPFLVTKSDNRGVYSFSLPTSKAIGYRVFAKTLYQETPTLKSQTLSFTVEASSKYFLKYILPWFLLVFLIFALVVLVVIYEKRTKRISAFFANIIETRLTPFAIKLHLKLQRLWYNFQQSGKSSQM